MLSTFSCVCKPSVCLWRNVCLVFWPIFEWVTYFSGIELQELLVYSNISYNSVNYSHHGIHYISSTLKKIIYLLLTVLNLHCCAGFSLVATRGGYSLVAVYRFLIAVASLIGKHEL